MFRDWIASAGLDQKTPISGLDDREVNLVEGAQGVRLPSTYKTFLRECGRSAGLLCYDANFFYPDIEVLKQNLGDLIEEEGVDFQLPDKAFVFSAYQGAQFQYFICDGNDDPPVYRVFDDGSVEAVSDSFSEYMRKTVEEYRSVFNGEYAQEILTQLG
ncbi:SMI1/KNR4 family protein [Lysobacter enzymogenes]|uniref:SMI1/KNR4 family protein n=1 Tax=Lysobacter enzymogenes TaxID=69 RepID=UPI001A96891E|nr:SMI1/KNR4 family protein [Lysobacter enzymogenes]QQP98184.1 SMI1/KNR4 family protein [Lysobacter enzymogenes]